jgi:uncharacterized RDD family membrane protein YckC
VVDEPDDSEFETAHADRWRPPEPYPGAPPPPPPYGPQHWTPGTPVLASYGVRVGGWLIDWLITSAIGALALLPIHAVHQTVVNGRTSLSVSTQGLVLSALIVIIYDTALIGSGRSQTLGMRALGIRVVDARGVRPVSYARALGRSVCEYVLILLFVIPWIIDMLYPLWDPRRQTLHDKVAETVVIRTS